MIGYAVGVLLTLYVGVMLYLVRRTMESMTRSNENLVREVRLATRTRVKQASLQSGAVTEEQIGKRLGKSTRAKRVVVGGDEDSELHTNLSRAVGT